MKMALRKKAASILAAAMIILAALPAYAQASSEADAYPDVPLEHYASGAIGILSKRASSTMRRWTVAFIRTMRSREVMQRFGCAMRFMRRSLRL
ncbi:hypothetical protein ACFPES_15200 [Paenibacillus sp. GCM10023248]|uniref:hypothetical protein n=1 Tax=unclassified Paenibacillus TaxID=185978 RepID=UPI002377EFE0|nr:hypothetical protein [Paenibacillus sp. MAHUQ-63]MDD9268386.1 hypothetical protein [Paenibacillus sp. MAHUQ-63]